MAVLLWVRGVRPEEKEEPDEGVGEESVTEA
jgi:hypothetical protein